MENNSQAIEIKGIVRNQTKIGVQDGQCDDLVNLRFKDGSWRVADDGKSVYNMTGGYSQLYVHTNVYHHLLGVSNNKLFWFANIESDGETFSNLDTPVEICDVQGDVTIVQNGHLLTIIGDGKSSINYAIFKSNTNEYKELKVNPNGSQTDRGLYPFDRIYLNLNCEAKEFTHTNKDAGKIKVDLENAGENFFTTLNHSDSGALVPADNDENADRTLTAKQLWHSSMLDVYNQAKEENYFTRPFLAIVAAKLYDGSYLYSSAPIYLSPIEKYSSYKEYYDAVTLTDMSTSKEDDLYYQKNMVHPSNEETTLSDGGYNQKLQIKKVEVEDTQILYTNGKRKLVHPMGARMPIYYSGAYSYRIGKGSDSTGDQYYTDEYLEEKLGYLPYQYLTSVLRGSSLVVTLGDLSSIFDNSDVFTSLSIFITKEVDIYKMGADNYKDGKVAYLSDAGRRDNADGATASYTIVGNVWYKPAIRPDDEIIFDLMHSPFYLLREYNINELKTMSNSSIEVDLSSIEYKGLLANIEQQPTLDTEAMERKDFFPKTVYQYNSKLHIANYKSNQFHGYPIDCFQLSNHNVKVKAGAYAIGNTLPDIEEGTDVQYPRETVYFIKDITNPQGYVDKALNENTYFAYIATTINTQQGEQYVIRNITPYRADIFTEGDKANFVESLNPLLTFPDYRATKITIAIISAVNASVNIKSNTFSLRPHPYLNLSYYIHPNLKPIDVSKWATQGVSIDSFLSGEINKFVIPNELNTTENSPNGLKVSMTNNPFIFPHETTYQVGSSEIVALMSNAVAVGTGQTGAAPLYVFCKDGIYALLVDSTGEMTYTNARIIARDVCNNAKSVTPIDSGVVFTTDRGLMSIAGSEVEEIGSAVEGEVFDITDTSDKAKKVMFNAFTMSQLAKFPDGLIGNTDFLTYLKGAIVNYNHNERELMVSNPNKDYTYVMDRNGNWSRRAFTAQEYVNNYPTSYRVNKNGKFYKVDKDDNSTNQMYLLSNVIKLGTIAFKQAYRLVVRGYFETSNKRKISNAHKISGAIKASDLDNEYIYTKLVDTAQLTKGSYVMKVSGLKATGIRANTLGRDETYQATKVIKIVNAQKETIEYGSWRIDTENEEISFELENDASVKILLYIVLDNATKSGTYDYEEITIVSQVEESVLGLYVFGSYDGRQWSLLGGNEKSGKFTDIGCKISHTDIRFLRVCLAGKLTKDSRIDYIEVSTDGSALNGKLR